MPHKIELTTASPDAIETFLSQLGFSLGPRENYHHTHFSGGSAGGRWTESWRSSLHYGGSHVGSVSFHIDTEDDAYYKCTITLENRSLYKQVNDIIEKAKRT